MTLEQPGAGAIRESDAHAGDFGQGRRTAPPLRIRARFTIIAITSIALLLRLPTMDRPLVEAHAFRQTQTAYTALEYHRHGIDLLQTPLPVLGPPWVVPFEFPLFQAIAALVMDAGVPSDLALRLTSLVFFLLSAFLLVLIVRREAGERVAGIAVIAFMIAPLGLLWSRTSTIESLAVAASLASVLGALRWDRGGSRRDFALAIVFGAIASLVKVTTAFVWLVPALFLLRRSRLAAVALVGVCLSLGVVWTFYADSIKLATAATSWLASSSSVLREWTFGTLSSRLDPTTWILSASWLIGLLGLLLILAPRALAASRLGRWALATLVLGPLVLSNLYGIHDYYWMAVAPAAAILVGLVIDHLLAMPDRGAARVRLAAAGILVALSFVLYPRWIQAYDGTDESATLRLAAQIKSQTRPEDLIAISGRDWSPALLYYADRRGFMEVPGRQHAPVGYVHFECPIPGRPGDCVRSP